MVEVSWILMLITQSHEPIAVYCSILENSVMYHHIAIKFIPIVNAETDWKSQKKGQTYILVLHEALWMGNTLDHNLVNTNQLCHYGNRV